MFSPRLKRYANDYVYVEDSFFIIFPYFNILIKGLESLLHESKYECDLISKLIPYDSVSKPQGKLRQWGSEPIFLELRASMTKISYVFNGEINK